MMSCSLARAATLTYLLLALSACGSEAFSNVAHLRRASPPLGVVGQAPAASQNPLDIFAKIDMNKDGKVDPNEFSISMQNGAIPVAMAPAPGSVSMAPAPAPARAPVKGLVEEELPAHLMVPPPLPDGIPEPPPPPRPPPAEPVPPPQPPTEGQLVGPPPSDRSIEAAGNVSALEASVPGLDLDGSNPLQSPNAPPPMPMPVPVMPPDMAQLPPLAPPGSLDPMLMSPPVSFGIDVANTVPAMKAALDVVAMPVMPNMQSNPSPNRV